LNIEYWNWENETAFSRYVGSYGRGTAIRGFSDLDMIFELPASVKSRFNNYLGNGQSALLQVEINTSPSHFQMPIQAAVGKRQTLCMKSQP
jgi:hypothetical protein